MSIPSKRSHRVRLAQGAFAFVLSASAFAAPAAAQQAAATPARPELLRAASDLRNLVTAQEAYFAEHNKYASSATETQFRPSTGNSVRLVKAEANRWSAELTGTGIDGSCVIYVNLATADAPRTAKEHKVFPEGEPACDGDGESEDTRWAKAAEWESTSTLARIVKLQEQRFGKTGAYAATLAELEGYRANGAVTVTLTTAPAGSRTPGYLVTTSHARFPNARCIVFSGFGPWLRAELTSTEHKRPGGELQIACDEFKK